MSMKTEGSSASLEFRELSRSALEEHARQFHSSLDERVRLLTDLVRSTAGFDHWQPDLTRESLEQLGLWFEGQVRTRERSADEIQRIKRGLQFQVDVPATELTDETFAIASDVGKYLSRTVMAAVLGLEWKQNLDNKQAADYGHPVLVGRSPVAMNPARLAINTAYGISRGKGARLGELYDYWIGSLRGA